MVAQCFQKRKRRGGDDDVYSRFELPRYESLRRQSQGRSKVNARVYCFICVKHADVRPLCEAVQGTPYSAPVLAGDVLDTQVTVTNLDASSFISLAIVAGKGRRLCQSVFKLLNRLGKAKIQV